MGKTKATTTTKRAASRPASDAPVKAKYRNWMEGWMQTQAQQQAEFRELIQGQMREMQEQISENQRQLTEAMDGIRQELHPGSSQRESPNIDAGPGSSTSSQYGNVVYTQTTTIPKFYGDRKKNPVRFLEELNLYFRKINLPESARLEAVTEALQGAAGDWGNLHRINWGRFDQFREAFLERYWSELEQNQLRQLEGR